MSKHIGNYEIVSELGRGGMGVVYKAREESLQRFVAIKMLGNQLVGNESIALRFMREARAVADLNHPNLVQVFRVDRHEDHPYFVMEYVEGESLKRLIQREDKMQPLRALQILKEVATGLAAAHDKGVIHRDIKPENIMLTKYGGVKVVDFGIARVEEPGTRLTTTGMGLGTPSYLSPEVCLSQDVDQRSDIFSLGVVLFEMLTGDTPFKSDSPFELMTKVVEARIPDIKALNPNVDDGARQILAKMIAKRPRLRYQNCNELISDIEDYQAGRVPRWARNMPLEIEPVDRSSAQADAPADEEASAVDEPVEAITMPIPTSEGTPSTIGVPQSERTVALAHEPTGGRRGRLALVAVLLLVTGGAIAGSWYLRFGPDRPMLAMFEPAPEAVDDGAEAGTDSSADIPDEAPVKVEGALATEAAPNGPANPSRPDDGGAEPDGAARVDGDTGTPTDGNEEVEFALNDVIAETDANVGGEDEAPAQVVAETGESSGGPLASIAPARTAGPQPAEAVAINLPVTVVAVGDPAVAGVVSRQIKQALREI